MIELREVWRLHARPGPSEWLITNAKGRPLDRHVVSRIVARCARIAGIGHVHPTSSATPWPPKPSTEA